jgi:pilus assembly protein Flp/PilA
MKALLSAVRAFAQEEDGVALTEYLILLALLVGGVITAVTLAGDNLAIVWNAWAGWFTAELAVPGGAAPAP